MIFIEFKTLMNRKIRFERIGYWFQCLFGISLSLPFLISTIIYPEKYGEHPLIGTAISFSVFSIVCVSLYKLINKYKITIYKNELPENNKKDIIFAILKRLPITKLENKGNYFFFTYQKNNWRIDYEIDLLVDNEQIAFMLVGRGFNRGGLIDFGRSKKLKQKLVDEIEIELS